MKDEIEKNEKTELKNRLDEVYFRIESSFKTLFYEHGSNEKRFSTMQEFVQKELLTQLERYSDNAQGIEVLIKKDETVLYPALEGDILESEVLANRSGYFVDTLFFRPWGWEIYAFKDKTHFDGLISKNKKLIGLTVFSIISAILVFLYFVIEAGVKLPLQKIIQKIVLIKEGRYETIDISSSYELDTLVENINNATFIIKDRESSIKEQLKYTKGILEAQESIVLIADQNGVMDANRMFFDTFSAFSSIDEFKKRHGCICDFFEDTHLEGYIGKVSQDNSFKLYREIAEHKDKTYKVALKPDGKTLKYFSIKVNNPLINNKELFIIVLTDITKEENYRLYLEDRIKEEVEKNRESEKKLFNLKRQQSLSELLTNIAHQWRQPLNVISLSLNEIDDMVEDGDIDREKIQNILQMTNEEIHYISDIITTLTKLNSAKSNSVFRLDEAIKDSADSMRELLDKNSFKLKIETENISVKGDRRSLSDIIAKMINNSIDQALKIDTKDRHINIVLKASEGFAHIEIEDSSGGIAKEIMDNIFDPYTTTAFKSRGKGLSLYLAKSLIENNFEGEVSAKNSHHGAVFTIKLPLSV